MSQESVTEPVTEEENEGRFAGETAKYESPDEIKERTDDIKNKRREMDQQNVVDEGGTEDQAQQRTLDEIIATRNAAIHKTFQKNEFYSRSVVSVYENRMSQLPLWLRAADQITKRLGYQSQRVQSLESQIAMARDADSTDYHGGMGQMVLDASEEALRLMESELNSHERVLKEVGKRKIQHLSDIDKFRYQGEDRALFAKQLQQTIKENYAAVGNLQREIRDLEKEYAQNPEDSVEAAIGVKKKQMDQYREQQTEARVALTKTTMDLRRYKIQLDAKKSQEKRETYNEAQAMETYQICLANTEQAKQYFRQSDSRGYISLMQGMRNLHKLNDMVADILGNMDDAQADEYNQMPRVDVVGVSPRLDRRMDETIDRVAKTNEDLIEEFSNQAY